MDAARQNTSFESPLNSIYVPLTPLQKSNGKSRCDKWDPAPYNEQPAKQEALNCISLRDPFRSTLFENENRKRKSQAVVRISQSEYEIVKNPVKLAKFYDEQIRHHVVIRVALFFQQAIICYKTPFHYEIADTEGQLFCAKNLKVISPYGDKLEIKYQAAHSSTIPSLKACPVRDYQNALAKRKEPKYFSFLEDSYMANLDNSTNSLPTFVNQVDTLIDGKSTDNDAMRIRTINLLNRLAGDDISPCDATRVFLEELLQQLRTRPALSKKMTPEKKKTISIYKRQVKEMIFLASTSNDSNRDNTFFDNLLMVNHTGEKHDDLPKIRKIVYERKFEIIREAQYAETMIHKIIKNRFPDAISPIDKHVLRLCLLARVKQDPELKKVLQKLFAISIDGIETDRKLCQQLNRRYEANSKSYDKTLRDIRQIVYDFQKIEKSFQAHLLSDFRTKLRHITQLQLSAAIKDIIQAKLDKEFAKEFPNNKKIRDLQKMATSQSTISRLENSRLHILREYKTPENQRRKDLTLYHAKIISKALKINPGHYFCSFFASADVK